MALEVILQLDEAQDFHTLSTEEHDIIKSLKGGSQAWRFWKGQERTSAPMVNLKEGDANTKYFHMEINSRRRRIFILRLKRGSRWVTKHDETEQTIHTHCTETMNKGPHRSRDLNWENICLPECDLCSLADDFTEEVVVACQNPPASSDEQHEEPGGSQDCWWALVPRATARKASGTHVLVMRGRAT
jgi:hypothetical protein